MNNFDKLIKHLLEQVAGLSQQGKSGMANRSGMQQTVGQAQPVNNAPGQPNTSVPNKSGMKRPVKPGINVNQQAQQNPQEVNEFDDLTIMKDVNPNEFNKTMQTWATQDPDKFNRAIMHFSNFQQ